MTKLKIVSWNVNSVRARADIVARLLDEEQPDILCLQETKIQQEQLTPEMTDLAGYRSYWSMAEKKGYSGVVTYTEPEPVGVGTGITMVTGTPSIRIVLPTTEGSASNFLIQAWCPSTATSASRLLKKTIHNAVAV